MRITTMMIILGVIVALLFYTGIAEARIIQTSADESAQFGNDASQDDLSKIEGIVQQARKYDHVRRALGWESVCVSSGQDDYTISSDYSVSDGCSMFGNDASVTISPSVLDSKNEQDLVNAYKKGQIRPSMSTRLRVVYVCKIQRQCN